MRPLLAVTATLLLHFTAMGADSTKTWRVGFLGQYVKGQDISQSTLGVLLEVPVGKRAALDYHFSLGKAEDGTLFYHLPAFTRIGVAGMNYFGQFDSKFSNAMGLIFLLTALIPEGISYRVDAGQHVQVIPYLRPLGQDYFHSADTEDRVRNTLEAGTRFSFMVGKKFYFAPHIGMKMYYFDQSLGVEGGISCGLRLHR